MPLSAMEFDKWVLVICSLQKTRKEKKKKSLKLTNCEWLEAIYMLQAMEIRISPDSVYEPRRALWVYLF